MKRRLLLMMALAFALPPAAQAQVQIEESMVRIHVSGSVKHPGVYTLPRGARGVDAIQAAGGVSAGALLSELNLASLLEDGQRLEVPNQETPKARITSTPASTRSPSGGSARRSRASRPNAPVSERIALNRANLEDLVRLPGIGPTLAEEILRYRQQHGRFRTLDELKEVPGIGQRRFERLAPLLTL